VVEKTYFKLPNSPEEFGVVLESPNLRRIDFSALEYPEIRRALIEYIKTYHPDQFNDFVANNGIIMLVELISYLGSVLTQREDIIADDGFLPTSQSITAVDQHLFLINNKIQRATPAIIDMAITLPSAAPTSVRIPAGTHFNLAGADGAPVTYEIFRAPNDFDSEIIIFPGARGVVAFGIEGSFAEPLTVESAGGSNQIIEILDEDILEEPIVVEVVTGNESVRWRRVDTREQASAQDEIYEIKFHDEGISIVFGDNIAGKAPIAGQRLTVLYRLGGGRRGRIPANAINESRPISPDSPISAPVQVLFRNPAPSNGGMDIESIASAKKRAPKESAILQSAVSGENYSVKAKTFNHPIFGSVLKAVATVRTSLNANIVELYILAIGPDDIPVLPSKGLKQGLVTYFADVDVLTDETRVLDGAIKPINVNATVIISRNSDPALIRDAVDVAVTEFFDQTNFDMGQELHLSKLYKTLGDIEGVQYVKIYSPQDDVIVSGKIATETPANQIGFNELIVLGEVQIKIYFEKAQI